ncbi:UNVERIFIED_CONTAM: hypothetical protein FKN15_019820 [Acipenser sinensis]
MGVTDVLEIESYDCIQILATDRDEFSSSNGSLVLDCRPFLSYSRVHVKGSRSVNWNSMLRRRSKSSTVSLEWLVPDRALLARLRGGELSSVVVLDEESRSVADLKADSLASMLLNALASEVQPEKTQICFLQDGKNTDSHLLVEKLLKKSQRDVVQLGTSPSAATPVSAAAKKTTGPASSTPVSASHASSQANLSTGTSTGHDQTTLQSNEVTQSLPPTPSPRPASLFCDFELNLCGWENCRSGDFNWLLRRERLAEFETQTLPDGHASCRNFAGEFAFCVSGLANLSVLQNKCLSVCLVNTAPLTRCPWQYLYMEAAFPRESGQTAVLVSPVFKGPKCLSFWYSLIGDGVEAVTVYVAYVSSPDSWHKLWSASGAMPRRWSFQQLDLFVTPEEEFQILLEGTISNNYCGDAAIDDLSVSENRCTSFKRLHRRRELPATPAPEGSPSVSTAPVLPPPEVLETLFCDFEKGLCGWSQCTSDEFDWELHQERLPPLLSATQPDSQVKCRNLEGSLSVYMQYVSKAGIWHKLWSVGGNKSRKWHLADLELFVDPNETFQLAAEMRVSNGLLCCFVQLLWLVTDGKNTDSHLLVEKLLKESQRDVVRLSTSPSVATPVSAAAKETTSASSQANLSTGTSSGHDQTTLQSKEVTQSLPPTPSSRPASLFCDFELTLCGWENCRSGDFNWLLRRERPAEFETHPPPDGHASCRNFAGESAIWQYLYMEAAFPRESGQTAVLLSPVFKGPKCLSFWYSLFGDGVGSLSVYMQYVSTAGIWHKLWSVGGNKSRKWHLADLELFVDPNETFQIILEGTIGNNPCGDVGVDDVFVTGHHCGKGEQRAPCWKD